MDTLMDLTDAVPSDPLQDDGTESDEAESIASSSDASEAEQTEEDLLADLESRMYILTLDAETIIAAQPRATQLHLTKQTRALLQDYKQHGSMIRLKLGIDKFLSPNPDDDHKLRFEWPENVKAWGRRDPTTGRPAHYGGAFLITHTDDDDDEFESYSTIPCPANAFDNPLFPDFQESHLHPLRIIDPESIPYVTTLPWNPLALSLTWPVGLQWPRGLLGKLNTILSVVDYEARVRLFHHVSRYGPSPIFRAGIAQQLQSHYSTIFQTARHHYLGFTPETRSFLRSVYEKKTRLNRAEKRLLAQVCTIAEGSIDVFWQDLNEERKGVTAMKIFIMARELEKSQEARNLETKG